MLLVTFSDISVIKIILVLVLFFSAYFFLRYLVLVTRNIIVGVFMNFFP